MKIQDFGEKIGGARKDLWGGRGLSIDDLYSMNDAEKKKYVVRDEIWKMPTAIDQVEKLHLKPFIALWQREAKKYAYREPYILSNSNFDKEIKKYIQAITEYRDLVMACTSKEDIENFYKTIQENFDSYKGWKNCWNRCIDYRVVNFKWKEPEIERKIRNTNFPYKEKSKSRPRKRTFIPPQLDYISRNGPDYRHGCNITPGMWTREFGFRAIEFGNWMSQKDRQVSMNYCFDALKDLAEVLEISEHSITFNGSLALAFGARGRSNACAHYEPMREVINLTKMHGAGSTAHEWFHSLDDKLAKEYGFTSGKLASEIKDDSVFPESLKKLKRTIKYDADGRRTDFYNGSLSFDQVYSKSSHGYWASTPEMLARAFACYVKDNLSYDSDYLIAHADTYIFEFDDQSISAIPQGEERAIINESFDEFFKELKDLKILEKREQKKMQSKRKVTMIVDFPELKSDPTGQYCLFM